MYTTQTLIWGNFLRKRPAMVLRLSSHDILELRLDMPWLLEYAYGIRSAVLRLVIHPKLRVIKAAATNEMQLLHLATSAFSLDRAHTY